MKRLILAIVFASTVPALAQQQTSGYYKRDGSYVEPYHHTAPDGNKFNNYSTQGNINPYTGQSGTVNPYRVKPVKY